MLCMISMKNKLIYAVMLMALVGAVSAHVEELPQSGQESLHLKGYDITFLIPTQKMYANDELQLSIIVKDSNEQLVTGLEVQGQMLDTQVGKEIFYAAVSEVQQGIYAFTWKPSFAGDYFVQFVFRSEENEILQPTFRIRIDDKREQYAWIFGVVAAALSIGIGLYAALPKKHRKFRTSPLIIGVAIGILIIGLAYSVATFYQKGGEKGFIVCGPEGCELAAHWHSQLEMSVCGEPFHLPLEAGDLNKQHTHKERDRLHFHALIKTDEKGTKLLEPDKVRLGELFDFLGIRFTNECFGEYCNGDSCPDGTVGNLTMNVNGVPNIQYDDYVWKDGDVIKIAFGP